LAKAIAKFKDVTTLQKFVSGHASRHSHVNQGRHLDHRGIFERNRSTALTNT